VRTQRTVISNTHLYIVTSAIWLFTATLIQIIFLKIIHRSGYVENIANIHTLFQLFLFSFDKHNSVGWQRGPCDCVRSEPRQAGRKLDEILRNAARAVAISCMPIFMRAPTLKKKNNNNNFSNSIETLWPLYNLGEKKLSAPIEVRKAVIKIAQENKIAKHQIVYCGIKYWQSPSARKLQK